MRVSEALGQNQARSVDARGSMTSTASYYGFVYTIFGLGASHMGLIPRARGKSLPGLAYGLGPCGPTIATTDLVTGARGARGAPKQPCVFTDVSFPHPLFTNPVTDM
jgi:hypothetical protein